MEKSKIALQKTIADADKLIASAETAKVRKKQAEEDLSKLEQSRHLNRLYDVGRILYDIDLIDLDDAVIAGIMLRGKEAVDADKQREGALREKGQKALTAVREKVLLEVLVPDRPDRSTAAKLREAGLKKQKDLSKDGQRWSRYSGEAAKSHLERRLKNTTAVINIMTS